MHSKRLVGYNSVVRVIDVYFDIVMPSKNGWDLQKVSIILGISVNPNQT